MYYLILLAQVLLVIFDTFAMVISEFIFLSDLILVKHTDHNHLIDLIVKMNLFLILLPVSLLVKYFIHNSQLLFLKSEILYHQMLE